MNTKNFFRGILVLGIVFRTSFGYALPEGGQVVGGNATFNTVGAQQLDIHQTTDRALIHWNQFNIDPNESVRFLQPGSEAIALNRVTGLDPSSIMGHLSANGRVFLLNPNGILFGPNAVVDVAGLLVTTMAVNENDFMTGKNLLFKDGGASVINQGKIHVSENGFVILVADGVKNEGQIIARLGKVMIGSGEQFAIDFLGDGLIQYALQGDLGEVLDSPLVGSPAVHNTGEIVAEGGEVVLSARGSSAVFRQVINQEGIIRANSLVNHGGVIQLIASDPVENTGVLGREANMNQVKNPTGEVMHTGLLDVSAKEAGAPGGEITLAGTRVDVSGAIHAREGNVLVTSTKETVLAESSLINTSGENKGSGGNVVIWSDDTTRFSGKIQGRGGDFGGNASSVEVSGVKILDFMGRIDLTAPFGKGGTLLLDPENYTTKESDFTKESPFIVGEGMNIIIKANDFITVHDIKGNDLLTLPENASLTLETQTGDIKFEKRSDTILASGTGSITVKAGKDVNVGTLQTNGGKIDITAAGDVNADAVKAPSGIVTIIAGGAIKGESSVDLTADTAFLSAKKDIGSTMKDYDTQVTYLTLNIDGNLYLDNKANELKTLKITGNHDSTSHTLKLEAKNLTFEVKDEGSNYLITTVSAPNLDFTFSGNKLIRVDNISVGIGLGSSYVKLDSSVGIERTGTGQGSISAGSITFSSSLGSIGTLNNALSVDTPNLTLNVGKEMYINTQKDLDTLSITSLGSAPKTYALTGGAFTSFTVTEDAQQHRLTAITDTTGLDFTFKGDKAIHVGGINVTPTGSSKGSVTLTSAVAINDDVNDSNVDITAAKAVLTGAGGIGVSNFDLDLDVGLLTAQSTNKDIKLNAINDIKIDAINAGTGNVTLNVVGMINDDRDDSLADITAKMVTLTATKGIGTINGSIDLNVSEDSEVKATSTTGGVNIQRLGRVSPEDREEALRNGISAFTAIFPFATTISPDSADRLIEVSMIPLQRIRESLPQEGGVLSPGKEIKTTDFDPFSEGLGIEESSPKSPNTPSSTAAETQEGVAPQDALSSSDTMKEDLSTGSETGPCRAGEKRVGQECVSE